MQIVSNCECNQAMVLLKAVRPVLRVTGILGVFLRVVFRPAGLSVSVTPLFDPEVTVVLSFLSGS